MASLPLTAIEDDALLSSLLSRFSAADACWFASVRPGARAHLAPIWHVWLAPCVYVVTQHTAVRAANVRANPWVSLSLPDPMNPIIIEGLAAPAPEMRAALRDLFQAKYAWDISTETDYDEIIAVTPRKVMAWGEHGEGRWQLT